MYFFLVAFIGGIAGTFVMDRGARRFSLNGVNDALGGLLGRWVLGFKHFNWVIDGHRELQIEETNYEKRIGSYFHYLIGGGCVALLYPLFFLLTGLTHPENHIFGGIVFGFFSVSLTWFLQYPCFGFGFFGKNAPLGSKTIIPPLILHTLYGLIVGIVIQYAMEYEVGY